MDREERIAAFHKRLAEEQAEKDALRQRLEREYGFPHDAPYATRLWDLAWEEGHSSGYQDVEHYYGEFASLVVLALQVNDEPDSAP